MLRVYSYVYWFVPRVYTLIAPHVNALLVSSGMSMWIVRARRCTLVLRLRSAHCLDPPVFHSLSLLFFISETFIHPTHASLSPSYRMNTDIPSRLLPSPTAAISIALLSHFSIFHAEVILMRIAQLCATFPLTPRRYNRLV
ncbi:hypothetical protein B0H14DRAFT_3471598 [Mycena olivaceomarginata]|nr:hypothetical protein B0H14DRAFT_3471598 [Mycena olivaceomarginata]